MTTIGVSRPRVEGRSKVTGTTRYAADLEFPHLAHVRLVLSPHASARITGYDLEAARALPGVIDIVTGPDLPELDVPAADQPLARGRVRYAGQPVVAVVAETPEAAGDAAALIGIDFEPETAAVDLFDAIAEGAPRVLDDHAPAVDDSGAHGTNVAVQSVREDRHHNVSAAVDFHRGDAESALAGSAHVVRGRWRMATVHQGFTEPHVVVAAPDPEGGFIVHTPTQGVFPTRRETARFLGLPISSVRVMQTTVGGGFGGKVLLLEPIACLLAARAGRPVRIELTRTEEFLMGRGAPGCVIDIAIGAAADGRLTGLSAKAWFDHGATAGGLSGLAGLFLVGTYRLAAYDYTGYEVASHKTPTQAYRAPGATQAFYALESAIDELAGKAGMDRLEFRLLNACREGDPRPDGGEWPAIAFTECLEAARRHPLYTAPREPGEGIGVAAGAWGGGREPAAAACRVEPDGSIVVHTGHSDISGSSTSIAMIAAETLGVAVDRVRVQTGDTDSSPYAGMAGGSKTIYSVGGAVQIAAADARRQLLDIAAEELEAAPEDLEVVDGEVRVAGVPGRSRSVGALAALAAQFGGKYPPVLGQGRNAITRQSPMFTVHICRVKVDAETGAWRLTGYAVIQDVGKAINPAEVEGQIHGGAVQALGRALGEQMAWTDAGGLLTASFIDYEMPMADQLPDLDRFDVQLVELPSPYGPFGAKGVGEPPAVPGPAAVASAIADVTGWRPDAMPVSWEILSEKAAEQH